MLDQHRHDATTPFDHQSEDALLLSEFAHRTANEIAAAAAAVHLAGKATGNAGSRLLEQAAGRLEAFGMLHRALARPVRGRTDVSIELTAVCRAIASGASGAARSVVSLQVPPSWVGGHTARRLVLVAAELVANAVRHALDGRPGRLLVSLDVVGEDIVLLVGDDGPGMRADAGTSGTGLGSGIVTQLVQRARGTISVDTGPTGTTVRVALPLEPTGDVDTDIVF
jgi:two-component sensor histidine kinase